MKKLFAELPVEFITPIGDHTVVEKQSITLTCEVSKPNKEAKWFKNGSPIEPSDRVVMHSEGTKHSLTINSAMMDDDSKYTVRIDEAESTGQLTVEGTSLN
jgi:hypothetical protein